MPKKKNLLRTVSWIVLLAFAAMLQVAESPLRAAPAGEKSGGESMAKADGTGYIEQEEGAPAKLAKKRFPWPIVLAGVVAAAAVVYFVVVLNKKYTLTVSVGEGITGTPTAGSTTYKKNKTVEYSYSLQSGYRDLAVMLDGTPVAASGSLKMDKDHALAASSTKMAAVAVNSTPSGAAIYDNGVDSGQTTNAVFDYIAGGTHKYLIRLCGYQDFEQTETAEMGAVKTVNATLVPGIYESFTVAAAPCWTPHTASEWTVSGGAYRFSSNLLIMNYNVFKVPFSQSTMTAEVKMNRVSGDLNGDNAVVLIDQMDGDKVLGYWFAYQSNGSDWFIVRFDSWDMYRGKGNYRVLANGRPRSITTGFNQWNTVKVVRAASQYSLYLNGTLVTTITDAKYQPRYLALGFILDHQSTQMLYEYVKLSLTGAAAAAGPAIEETGRKNWPEQE
jgi:hypothetical protein